MKKLFVLLALCAPMALNGMQPAATPVKESDEAILARAAKTMAAHEERKVRSTQETVTKVAPIIDTIRAKFNDGTLSIEEVEAYRKLYGDSTAKAQALANLFNSEFGAAALQRLKDLKAKLAAKEELTPAEKRIGAALSTLALMANSAADSTGVDYKQREQFTAVNRPALQEALGLGSEA